VLELEVQNARFAAQSAVHKADQQQGGDAGAPVWGLKDRGKRKRIRCLCN